MARQPDILVVGSVNMDLVARAARMPAPGETILANNLRYSPGGKGANQAVGCARLGAGCRFVGRVGDDAFGRSLAETLKAEGVDCNELLVTPEAATGVALIVVDAQGENSIVVASGANAFLTPDDLFARESLFASARIALLQLELPLPTVRAAIELARRHGCKVLLDPAPAPRPMPPELMRVDILSPNVAEAESLTGVKAIEERLDKNVASDLIARGAGAAVLKLGSRGCLVVVADGHFYRVPAYAVQVVDTTGAGDAFTAAFAVALTRGRGFHEAAKFANAAGALACTKIGAQQAMPTETEVLMLMRDQPL